MKKKQKNIYFDGMTEEKIDEMFEVIESKKPMSFDSTEKVKTVRYAIFSFNFSMFGWIHVYWQSENNYYYPEEGYWEVEKGFGYIPDIAVDEIKSEIDCAKGYYGNPDKEDFWYKCILVPFRKTVTKGELYG